MRTRQEVGSYTYTVPPSLPPSVPICRETLQTNFCHQRLAEKAFLLTETLCWPGNLCEWWIRCLLGVNLNLSVGKDAFCWEKNSSVRWETVSADRLSHFVKTEAECANNSPVIHFYLLSGSLSRRCVSIHLVSPLKSLKCNDLWHWTCRIIACCQG